jgi:pimeloyl-ACP methyl ester carboxylesterase
MTDPFRGTLERGDRSLSYLHWHGDGQLAPIVLAHPVNTQAAVWAQLAPLLVGGGASEVIAVDYRGHGRSSQFGPYGSRGYARDIDDVLTHLGTMSVHFMGGSIGGAVGVELIALGGRESLSLTLIAAGVRLRMPQDVLEDAITGVRELGPEEWFREHGSVILGSRSRPGVAEEIVRLAGGRPAEVVVEIIRTTFGSDDATDTAQSLLGGLPPTLIIAGEQDPTCPPAMAESMAGLFSTTPVILPGIGHLPSLEAPAEVADLVLPFITAAHPDPPQPSWRRK